MRYQTIVCDKCSCIIDPDKEFMSTNLHSFFSNKNTTQIHRKSKQIDLCTSCYENLLDTFPANDPFPAWRKLSNESKL